MWKETFNTAFRLLSPASLFCTQSTWPELHSKQKLINLPHDPNHDPHRPKSEAMTCIKARSYESTLKCAASRGLGIKYLCYSRLAKLKVFLYSALCRHARTHMRAHTIKNKQDPECILRSTVVNWLHSRAAGRNDKNKASCPRWCLSSAVYKRINVTISQEAQPPLNTNLQHIHIADVETLRLTLIKRSCLTRLGRVSFNHE